MKKTYLWANRRAVLASKHKKELVIAPPFKEALGVEVMAIGQIDTDSFGTFTREIKRPKNQIETALLKAYEAIKVTGESLAIASEGSFGIDPALPYVYSNREIVVLIDSENGLEIFASALSWETNYRHQVISDLGQVEEFALAVGFPSHGIIVRVGSPSADEAETIKGIITKEALTEAVNYGLKKTQEGIITLETDMRAMYNPTRMKNIAKATDNLIKKIKDTCPECGWPGFEVVESTPGLPCKWCGLPTQLTLKNVKGCSKCGNRLIVLYPEGVESADPSQCQFCNP